MSPQQQTVRAVVKNTFVDMIGEAEELDHQSSRRRPRAVTCDGTLLRYTEGKPHMKDTSESLLFTCTFGGDSEPEGEPARSGWSTPDFLEPEPLLDRGCSLATQTTDCVGQPKKQKQQPPMEQQQPTKQRPMQQQQHCRMQQNRVHQQEQQQYQQQRHHHPEQEPKIPEHLRTTVMLRNVPNGYSSEMLKHMLDELGFAAQYDFLYLPIDFRNNVSLGYAFVNMRDPAGARRLRERLVGFDGWAIRSGKVCEVSWSHPQQGLAEHIERYRNSPVMHGSMPMEYKPRLFRNGREVRFPAPTRPIKPVKLRKAFPRDEDETSWS